MTADLSAGVSGAASSSPVLLDPAGPLQRLPYDPQLERPKSFLERFDYGSVFYDVFRSVNGEHVYLIGPMALNLRSEIDAMTIEGLQSGARPHIQIHHGVQIVIARARLPRQDTHLRLTFGGTGYDIAIQPNRSALLQGQRAVFTVNKNNRLDWIADWARFYVRAHGATTAVVYENGSTDYTQSALAEALANVKGLGGYLIVPWPYPFGMIRDIYQEKRFGENWAMFAQPPIFTHFLRKYAMLARSIVNVDVDELVVSPLGKSIFRAVERAPFGTARFNRIWVENIRANNTEPPRHKDFVVRKKGRKAKDRGKKWALNPRRAWLASWRAQPWTHQVFGWLNLAGSRADFYGYHFIGISNSWYWDRTETPVFDPKIHERDKLLTKTFADVFGNEGTDK